MGSVVATLHERYPHREIAAACERLGLPEPPGEDGHTKRERVAASFDALADGALPAVAGQLLAAELVTPVDTAARIALEDVVWAAQGPVEIPKGTRRDIARALELDDLTFAPERFMGLLDRVWALGGLFDVLLMDESASLRGRIRRHVLCNPGTGAPRTCSKQLGAFDAGDARFVRFLEGLASVDVIPDEAVQRRVADAVSVHLKPAGAEKRQTGDDGGYPVFSVVSLRSGRARTRRTSSSPRPLSLTSGSPPRPSSRTETRPALCSASSSPTCSAASGVTPAPA